MKKFIISTIIFVCMLALSGIVKTKALAALPGTGVLGWAWGGSEDGNSGSRTCTLGADATDPACLDGNESGVGWISMNNSDCDTNADGLSEGTRAGCPAAGVMMGSYGVTIPPETCSGTDCYLGGYAWSENLGSVAFTNDDGYLNGHPAGGYAARRVGDKLEGWARFVDIADAQTNAGGWLGWIKLAGDGARDDGAGGCTGSNDYGNSNHCNYGVFIDSATGELGGYAWSDELGAIKLSGDLHKVKIPKAPEITLTSQNIDLTGGLSLPQDAHLTWTIKNDIYSCTNSGGNWGQMATFSDGIEDVSQSLASVKYTLSCTGPGGTASKDVTVNTVCTKKACDVTTRKCSPASAFLPSGSYDTTACSSTCTDDSGCVAPKKRWTNWKEVAP